MTNAGFLQIVYAPKTFRLFSYDQKNILKCNTGIIALVAALVMIAHFLLAAFITAGFVAIPIGYKFSWRLAQNRRLGICHVLVMGFITAETVVGLACPLTVLEHSLRVDSPPESFVSYWIKWILYWDLPHEIFVALYFLSFAWIIFLEEVSTESKIAVNRSTEVEIQKWKYKTVRNRWNYGIII